MGTASHDQSAISESHIRVKTRLVSTPPASRMKVAARRMWSAWAGSPASRSATYASTDVERSAGPPWKVAHDPSGRWCPRIHVAVLRIASAASRPR